MGGRRLYLRCERRLPHAHSITALRILLPPAISCRASRCTARLGCPSLCVPLPLLSQDDLIDDFKRRKRLAAQVEKATAVPRSPKAAGAEDKAMPESPAKVMAIPSRSSTPVAEFSAVAEKVAVPEMALAEEDKAEEPPLLVEKSEEMAEEMAVVAAM